MINTTPSVSLDQMRKVDQLMVNSYHISLRQMMENAGNNLANLVSKLYPNCENIVCFAGGGGNGGGTLVAARHLKVKGYNVSVNLVSKEQNMINESDAELDTLRHMGVEIREHHNSWESSDLVIDGMVGYNINGKLKSSLADLCIKLSNSGIPIISNDIPSGLHPDKGYIDKACIHANQTLTIALPKKGMMGKHLINVVGDIYLGNISVPASLYAKLEIAVSEDLFREEDVIPLF